MSRPRLIIGLMSGTSVDAIDAALVRVARQAGRYQAQVLTHVERRWPEHLRQRLLAVMAPAATTTQEICELNMLVAREFAAAVEVLLNDGVYSRQNIAAIASHGQTICHLPPARRSTIDNRKSTTASTLQIGDISALAAFTGIPTIGNFRAADMAVAGQGAPLVPWADVQLFTDPTRTRCIQNIGGIANVTYLPAVSGLRSLADARAVLAFDTGPGNMLLDAVMHLATGGLEHFDRDGRWAARGRLDPRLLRRLQAHPYFARRPPKSTGREDFGMALATSLFQKAIGGTNKIENQGGEKSRIENLLHTLTCLTAWSIADAYRRFLPRMPDEVILCGGGADNPVLVEMLAGELSGVQLRRIDDLGVPNKAKEAASFALLGAATLDGVPANMPSVTGATRQVVLGEVARPLRTEPVA